MKFGGMDREKVTKDMEKECCYNKNSELCPDCRAEVLNKLIGNSNFKFVVRGDKNVVRNIQNEGSRC